MAGWYAGPIILGRVEHFLRGSSKNFTRIMAPVSECKLSRSRLSTPPYVSLHRLRITSAVIELSC